MKNAPISEMIRRLDTVSTEILRSLVTTENPENDTDGVLAWVEGLRKSSIFEVERVPLASMQGWCFDENRNLRHNSGKFFSVHGIKVQTNRGGVNQWSQPIICQPEVGILGILCQKRDGVLKFLLQAKMEPGNVNVVQLSPTVQATRSNYTQVHGGKLPLYLEHFLDLGGKRVVVDQLQSEQGGRFFKKRNRNMVVELPPGAVIEPHENFVWLTLGQIKRLLSFPNMMNMNTRTVISCIQLRQGGEVAGFLDFDIGGLTERQRGLLASTLADENSLFTDEEIISWLTNLKSKTDLNVVPCGLEEVEGWHVGEWEIAHNEGRFFKVVGIHSRIGGREVAEWSQPLVQPCAEGIVGFITKMINGTVHVLVQAKLEAGNFDLLELAPSVQCITGSYKKLDWEVPFLDSFLNPRNSKVEFDVNQSEEGGRFFREENRNMILNVDDSFPNEAGEFFTWMTLRQVKRFMQFNNYLNVEARCLLANLCPV